jgi:hypothetical protein
MNNLPKTGLMVAGLLAFSASTWTLNAQTLPELKRFPDIDRREAKIESEKPSQREAAADLRTRVPGAEVSRHPVTGAPNFVGSHGKFLTGPNGEGGAVRAAAARSIAADDEYRPVKTFIAENRALFGHGPDALDRAAKKRDYRDKHNGLRTTVWQQMVDDIPVFEAILKAHTTATGELVNIGSTWVPDAEASATKGTPARKALLAKPSISAREALAVAGQSIGVPLTAEQIAETDAPAGAIKLQHLRAPGLNEAWAECSWLPMDSQNLRLCWQVVFSSKKRGEMFLALVDAESGEMHVRRCLTEYISDATYNVYTSDSPSPFSPGHPTPLTTQPPVVSRTLVTTPALNTTASPNGWIDDGVNETRGNNVDAHTDTNADNLPDLPRPTGSPNRVFDFPLDLAQPPSAYRNAAVTQLFYRCNLIHDQLYALGFTEAAGNFQNDNFGRGGLGNDAVQADAQDGSGTNNANFSTPPDGSPGRMQMYVFSDPTPDRDGTLDMEIVIHEHVHGLSNRLVGGGIGISALQTRGMGEGWSDFYGLSLLSEAGDDVDAIYAAGGYATYQLSALTQNYYFGIRRYPYSTNLSKNPLTFKDIDPSQASSHAGITRSPIIGNTADEVHNIGEVWCVTLWDARANLIKKHGFAVGNQLILQLVTDGMKLAPANPNFIQARNAILQAELALTAGANRGELWTAFARRGMGANATSPVSSTTVGLVENYDLPDNLAVTPSTDATVTGTVGGPFVAATYTLTNAGTASLNWTASDDRPWLDVTPASGTLAAGATATVTATPNSAANLLVSGTYQATIAITNSTSGLTQIRRFNLAAEPFTNSLLTEDFESGTLNPTRWATSGTATWRTQVATANLPHGGLRHLTMDSSVDDNYSRNEATLTVNLAGRSKVALVFWAKAFSDEPNGPPTYPFTTGADFDGVAISANGTTWYEVQSLRSLTPDWTKYTVDLDAAALAAGISYNSAFKIRFNQYDNYTIPTDGIAIDDISIAEVYDRRFTLNLPATVDENSAPVAATLNVIPAPASPLTVSLVSSLPASLSVPASVIVPAGQSSVNFDVTPTDDALLNGTRSVTISASALTYITGSQSIALQDNETAILSLNLPPNSVEGAGTVTSTVSTNIAPSVDIVVTLSSSAPADASVPATITIPAGQTSATFPVTIVDDSRIDGPVTATITAQVANWTAGTANITVADNENADLVVTLPASIREGDNPASGSVRIAGTLQSNLTVALDSSDTTELTVPASVVIPAGQTTATFSVTAVNDTDSDGAQNVTVTASGAGFANGSATIAVQDNDTHHFTVGPIASSVLRNALVPVTITAKDINDITITNYNQTVGFGAADANSVSIPVTPTGGTGFVNGVLSIQVKFSSLGTGVVFAVSDTGGHLGSSNSFDVIVGPLAQFEWDPISSPKFVDAPFPVTIRAVDAAGNPVPGYTGSPSLAAMLSSTVQVLTWTAYADLTIGGEYANTKQAISNHFSSYSETTTAATDPAVLASQLAGKHVFLIVEQENASDATLGTIGSSWSGVLTNFVNSGGTVIVCSNYTAEHLLLTNSGLLAATSTSSPSSDVVTKTADTPLNAGVATPFTGSYLHTYSTTNGTVSLQTSSGQPVVISRDIGSGHVVLIGTDFYTIGTGMDRVIANAVALAQPAVSGGGLPVSPSTAGPFVGGQWSGNISLPFLASSVRLRCSDGSSTGDSNAFDIQAASVPSGLATILAEDFESGSLNPAYWTRTGTGPYRTQISTQFSPHGGTKHLTMDSSIDVTDARNEATLSVNLAGRTGVVLKFWAAGYNDDPSGPPPAPFTGGADFDGVAISADGNTWWEVQGLRSLPSTYAMFTVNLDAAIAARGISYNSAFKIRFNQFDNYPLTTDGIVIDDILITGAAPASSLTVTLPAQVNEGAGPVSTSVSVSTAPTTDLVVSLASKSPSKITVPATVTILAGQTSTAFSMNVQDDSFVDGLKNVVITAVAPGYLETGTSVQVVDNDGGTLTLSLPATVPENAGSLNGTLTLGTPSLVAQTVSLSSSNAAALQVPATIAIPRGAISANVPLTVTDDTIIDGDQTVQVSATLPGWTSAVADVVVVDNEARSLMVSTPASFRESDSPKVGSVSLAGTIATDLVISLASSDTTEITVPASVTIPAGQTTAAFVITVQDDQVGDGPQPFTVTASALTFVSGTASGTVRDNDAHHFTFAPIGSPLIRNGPIPSIITAHDPSGAVVTDFNSPVTLSATGSSGPLTVSLASGGAFVNGTWNGSVQIDALATGVVLTVSDGFGNTGSSNPFDLVDGQVSRFEWDPIPSPQSLDTPFNVTLKAVDASGTTTAGYNGVANLAVLAPSENPTIGAANASVPLPIYTSGHDSRSNVLYVANELGGPAKIASLSLNVTSMGPIAETLTNWTIRFKHTTLTNLSSINAWDNAGWTTVYRASPTISSTGWVTFNFSTPYNYNGIDNLLIDFSMDRTATNSYVTYEQGTSTSLPQSFYGVSNSLNGDPLTWSGSTPSLNKYYGRPDIRFTTLKELPIRPSRSTAFANGVWTGQVSVPVSGNGLSLIARAGSVNGTSGTFNILPAVVTPGDETVFAEDFESGTFNPAYWTMTGTGAYHTVNSSSNGPHGGIRHMVMDSSTVSAGRNEGTVTVNLLGRSGVTLKFWAKEFNDSPHGPPPSPFPATGADFDGVAISADGGINWYEVQPLRTLTSTYAQLTVDLDAAMAARGLTYGSNFKIRFNQYDTDYVPYRGIAIDDILLTANPTSGFALTAPAQVSEGAGTLTATATLAAAAGTDTVIALTSTAPAKVTTPPSVTVPAGQTSMDFVLYILDDTITDGDKIVTITGTRTGFSPRTVAIKVVDNDPLPLSLAAPATLIEGATGTATLTLGAAPSGQIVISLNSSDPAQLGVPASVFVQAGQQTISFPVTAINDTKIDGNQIVTITASVPGWVDATATVQVTDNESRTIGLNGLSSVYEGVSVTGTVTISGTLTSNLVVNLSSNSSRYSVPASVTIIAGQTSVSFTATASDNTATDGTQSVTVTASAATFTTATQTLQVFDNDVHHFGFSSIASQQTSVPFGITVTAKDVNDVLITPFVGTVSFSAAGDGGLVNMSPAASGPFSSGSWTGNVTCNTARTNVRITATSGGISSQSNPFTVQNSPAITVSPSSLAVTVNQGSTATRTVTIGNSGGGTLTWNMAASAAFADVASEGPVFSGNAPVSKDVQPQREDPAAYVESRPIETAVESGASDVALATALTNLNSNNGLVRTVIPNRYAFFEGETGTNIGDGGSDMYDGGNYLGTNLGTNLPYSDNAVVTSTLLGSGGKYFTRKYDGLWVFAADVAGLTYFEVTGNLGADGSGATDSAVLSVVRDGVTYRGFVKRVYNAFDPSVNHLIITADNGSVTHAVSTDTNDDYHRLTNLTGVTRIYYLLYAGTGGAYIDNTAAQNIMSAFLDAVSVPDWITPLPSSGGVTAGNSQDVTLTLSAANLTQGTYNRTIIINSNDPAMPQASLPVTLTVLGVPNLTVSPASGLSGNGPRGGPFTPGSQAFTLSNPGPQPLNWTASKTASWIDISPSSGTLNPGATVTVNAVFNVNANSLASGSFADTLTFTNTTNGLGNTTRPVALNITPVGQLDVSPADGLTSSGSYGGPFTPTSKGFALTNVGDAPINWSATETAPWLNISSTSGTLAPGGTVSVVAVIAAATVEPGDYAHSIAFTNTTNGRGNTTRDVVLHVILPAPVLAPEPQITPSTSNTITWNSATGASKYEAQVATDPTFASVSESGPITTTSHTFTGLKDGTQYYYRVRAQRNIAAQTGLWSQTTQAEFGAGTATNVSLTTNPGSVVLGSGTTWVENFDEPGSSPANTIFPDVINSWNRLPLSTSTYPNTSPGLPINQDGDLEATGLGGAYMSNVAANRFIDGVIEGYLYPTQTSSAAGFHLRGQMSPLQGYLATIRRMTATTAAIQFSVYGFPGTIAASPEFSFSPPNEHFKLRFSATGTTLRVDLWRVTVSGGVVTETPVILENGVNYIVRTGATVTSGVAGIYALMSGSDLPAIDDVTVTAGSGAYLSSGTLSSPLISPAQWQRWGTLSFTKDTGGAGTGLTVDVLNGAGALLASNVSSGTDLNSIPTVANQSAIKLRANLTTSNSANSPRLDDWTVEYVTVVAATTYSDWSNVETSTQFNAPPLISQIDDQTIDEDGTRMLSFSISDDSTPVNGLIVTASSSNSALVPPNGILLTGVGIDRAIQVTPVANGFGSAVISVSVLDGEGKASLEEFRVDVLPVNDAPQFAKGADQTVPEDGGATIVSNWATQISAGPANEGNQVVQFTVTTDHPELFAVLPAITPDGTLSFTSAPDASGVATATVRLHDNGGVANGGVDTSAAQTLTIQVTAVNDAPQFTKGANQTVLEDSGATTVQNWATQISAGAADEGTQSLHFTVTTDQPELFAVLPAITPDGTLSFTPAPDANGVATATVRLHDNGGVANGGVDTSVAQTLTIQVTAVNDAPQFTKGANQTVLEDSGATTVPNWATQISAGAADEGTQSLHFTVTTDHPELFAVLPAITPDGTLSFTPAPDASGVATATVRLHDNGGVANGGVDTSAAQTLTIQVTAVNDAPQFTKGANQTVLEDSGATTVQNWATQISAGAADEGTQSLHFTVTADQPELFAVLPAITPDGTLSFTPAPDASGVATTTVRMHDNGGVANGGVDTSVAQTLTIQIAAVNDVPQFTKGGNQTVLEDSGATTVPNWATQISAGTANESTQSLHFTVTTDQPELFAVQPAVTPDGTLSFTPAPNANGVATATVQLHDSGGTTDGGTDASVAQTVSIQVTAVNDAPGFAVGSNQTIRQNAGAQSVAGWATQITKGPANEDSQVVEFLVSTDHPELFETLPAISPGGTLTFTPAANMSGAATVTARIRDDGGTANGGMDASEPQTFTISATFVNDAPTFVLGSDIQAGNDAGPQSYPSWVTAISAGPSDEAGQLLDFRVTVDDPALFASLPAIAADGTLTFAPAPAASGTATVTVQLHDNGGTEDGGLDLSEPKSFKIAITTFVEEAGSYSGLISAADGVHPSAMNLGLLRANLSPRGVLSGKLTIKGRSRSFKGRVDSAGVAHFAPNDAPSLAIQLPGQPARSVKLKFDVHEGTDSLTGTVEDGSSTTAVISASRSLYSANPNSLPPYASVPREMIGSYTFVIGNTLPINAGVQPGQYPQGYGSGVLRIAKTGRVRIAAWLPDGVKFGYGNDLSKTNAWPLYFGLRNGYAIGGMVTFRDIQSENDVDGLNLAWFRPNAGRSYYPHGWPDGLTTDLVGSKYNQPARGAYIFDNMQPANGAGNAIVALHDGGLPIDLEQPINILPGHVRAIAPNSSKVQFRINPHTGLFQGSFQHPKAGDTKVRGAVLQKQSRGAGSFRTNTEAGGVVVSPK